MTCLVTASLRADEETKELSSSEQQLEAVTPDEPDSADEILELIKDHPEEMPAKESPSRFMVFVREYGLAIVYSYYDLKAWIVKKVCGERS